MIRMFTIFLMLLVPLPALAQGLPALFDVTGVASDDVLNVRSEPRAGAPLVTSLAPDARNIEVVRVQNGWGRVTLIEASGWVSMRYLQPQPGGGTDRFPQRLTCYGTEPGWSLVIGPDAAEFATLEGETLLKVQERLTSRNHTRRFALMAGSPDMFVTATITPAMCNDGMSDTEFGLAISAVTRMPDGYSLLSGCCTLRSRP